LVIVDLTEHKPNVLFELGMRIAFNKPVCLIRARGTAPIFDIDHMLRVFDYNPCLWASTPAADVPALSVARGRGLWGWCRMAGRCQISLTPVSRSPAGVRHRHPNAQRANVTLR